MRRYRFTAEEAAIMRRQYERKVKVMLIAEQWGIEGGNGLYDTIYALFRKHDPSFKTFVARKREAPKWCAWCGDNMPPFSKRKYCKDKKCKRDREPKNWCACGKRKGWGNIRCKACEIKRRASIVSNHKFMIRYMAEGGYSNKQIATKTELSVARVKFYRRKLGLPTPLRAWRPEQEAYWKAKTIEAGSAKSVYEKSGLGYRAFLNRLHRSGFRAMEHRNEARNQAAHTEACGDAGHPGARRCLSGAHRPEETEHHRGQH